jgi:hypothetical protein
LSLSKNIKTLATQTAHLMFVLTRIVFMIHLLTPFSTKTKKQSINAPGNEKTFYKIFFLFLELIINSV